MTKNVLLDTSYKKHCKIDCVVPSGRYKFPEELMNANEEKRFQ